MLDFFRRDERDMFLYLLACNQFHNIVPFLVRFISLCHMSNNVSERDRTRDITHAPGDLGGLNVQLQLVRRHPSVFVRVTTENNSG